CARRGARVRRDGQSVLPLIDGSDTAPRTTFAEMHVEDNPVLCFMVRRGRDKLNLMVGVDAQLSDLEADPGEWDNLIGRPEHAATEAALRQALAERFDFEAIETD